MSRKDRRRVVMVALTPALLAKCAGAGKAGAGWATPCG